MAKDLEKQYNPADVEDRTYQFWVDNGYFHADVKSDKKPYTIVIPLRTLQVSFIWDMLLIIPCRISLSVITE